MKTYPFSFNENSFEIFPEKIFSNQYVVYHGTCEYHSENIETNGFLLNIAPFEIDDANALCSLLQTKEFSPFDTVKGRRNQTTAQAFSEYLNLITSKDAEISFYVLSSKCIMHSTGNKKGGQSLKYITESEAIINSAISKNKSLKEQVDTKIENLFTLAKKISNTRGVVYAIELPNNLRGISAGGLQNTIYSTNAIPKERILAKTIIPQDFSVPTDNNQINKLYIEKFNNYLGKDLNNGNRTKVIIIE